MCLGNQNSKFCVRNTFWAQNQLKTQCRSTKKRFQVLLIFFRLKNIFSFQDFLPEYEYLLWERISRAKTFFHLNFRSISRLSEINILVRQKSESLNPNLAQNIIPGVPICFAVFLIPNWIIWTTSHTRNMQHLIFTQSGRSGCVAGFEGDLSQIGVQGWFGWYEPLWTARALVSVLWACISCFLIETHDF